MVDDQGDLYLSLPATIDALLNRPEDCQLVVGLDLSGVIWSEANTQLLTRLKGACPNLRRLSWSRGIFAEQSSAAFKHWLELFASPSIEELILPNASPLLFSTSVLANGYPGLVRIQSNDDPDHIPMVGMTAKGAFWQALLTKPGIHQVLARLVSLQIQRYDSRTDPWYNEFLNSIITEGRCPVLEELTVRYDHESELVRINKWWSHLPKLRSLTMSGPSMGMVDATIWPRMEKLVFPDHLIMAYHEHVPIILRQATRCRVLYVSIFPRFMHATHLARFAAALKDMPALKSLRLKADVFSLATLAKFLRTIKQVERLWLEIDVKDSREATPRTPDPVKYAIYEHPRLKSLTILHVSGEFPYWQDVEAFFIWQRLVKRTHTTTFIDNNNGVGNDVNGELMRRVYAYNLDAFYIWLADHQE